MTLLETHKHTLSLFGAGMRIPDPWFISGYEFYASEKTHMLSIDFKPRSRFACAVCGHEGARPDDATRQQWRHLNFSGHRTIIEARVPKAKCVDPVCLTATTISVPWAAKGSRFTLLFEAYVMALTTEMSVKAIADYVGECDQRIWKIIHRNVGVTKRQKEES